MVPKTRDRLIEVARQLFARNGVDNTTMNDIATAGGKGRRTLYTYFKNKREIYNAVIERDSDRLVSRLKQVVEDPALDPAEKLRRYIAERIQIVHDVFIPKEGNSLLSLISRDSKRVERIRRSAIAKEQELFRTLIAEGVEAGVFRPEQAKRLGVVQALIFQGVDYTRLPIVFDEIGLSVDDLGTRLTAFLVDAVLK